MRSSAFFAEQFFIHPIKFGNRFVEVDFDENLYKHILKSRKLRIAPAYEDDKSEK